MKLRNYEKRIGVLFLIIILLVIVVLFLVFTFFYKIPNYYLINGVVFRDDLLEVIVSDDEMKILYKNGYVYIDDKKYKYDISDTVLDVLVKDGKQYNIVYVGCKLDNEKENDIVELTFREDKIRLFKIFETIWEGV